MTGPDGEEGGRVHVGVRLYVGSTRLQYFFTSLVLSVPAQSKSNYAPLMAMLAAMLDPVTTDLAKMVFTHAGNKARSFGEPAMASSSRENSFQRPARDRRHSR